MKRLVRAAARLARGNRRPQAPPEELLARARHSGDAFKTSEYFESAESGMAAWFWPRVIWPMIQDLDFSCVLDLAAGWGRNAEMLRQVAEKIIVVDINEECIEACRARFAGDERFTFLRNDGVSLDGVENDSVSLLYCFDAMVHFDREVIHHYMAEFRRVLRPGGSGFCHYSNRLADGEDFRDAPHWRSSMSQEHFHTFCAEQGLEIRTSRVIDWGSDDNFTPGLDALTVFTKPSA